MSRHEELLRGPELALQTHYDHKVKGDVYSRKNIVQINNVWYLVKLII